MSSYWPYILFLFYFIWFDISPALLCPYRGSMKVHLVLSHLFHSLEPNSFLHVIRLDALWSVRVAEDKLDGKLNRTFRWGVWGGGYTRFGLELEMCALSQPPTSENPPKIKKNSSASEKALSMLEKRKVWWFSFLFSFAPTIWGGICITATLNSLLLQQAGTWSENKSKDGS